MSWNQISTIHGANVKPWSACHAPELSNSSCTFAYNITVFVFVFVLAFRVELTYLAPDFLT